MQSANATLPREPEMEAVESANDEHLMALLCDGQDQALAELVGRYQNDVFRFCLHYVKDVEVAKEQAQETFLRVFKARERFDTSRRFKPWMLCIARNLCLNELKRKKTVLMETLEEYVSSAREDSGELLKAPADGADESMMTEERRVALMAVLDTLPDEAREIVVLRYFEQLSAREIAEVVDSTEGAVRTRLHRSLKQMRGPCETLLADM